MNEQDQEICIVALGAVLPEVQNVSELWEKFLTGRPIVHALPNARVHGDCFYQGIHALPHEKIPPLIASTILPTQLKNLPNYRAEKDLFENILIQATTELLTNMNPRSFARSRKTAMVLGMMQPRDESFTYQNNKHLHQKIYPALNPTELDRLQKISDQFHHNHGLHSIASKEAGHCSEIFRKLNHACHLDLRGYVTDSACASSLASIAFASSMLKSHQMDLVLTGGIDCSLGIKDFLAFSVLDILAPEVCYPFDRRSQGVHLGEGVCLFALQRYADALQDGHPILGVIRGIGTSSDGQAGGLTTPSLQGQLLAYRRAYHGISPILPDYIEAHGTGTPTGDKVELESLAKFFHQQKIPIGSARRSLAILAVVRGRLDS